MRFPHAKQYALEFWAEPEHTPFPTDVQDTLLASRRADLLRIGAMSVVYNGLLAVDTEYIDVAEDILRDIPLDEARTGDAMAVARDICYLGLFRALIDPAHKGDFGTSPKNAFRASVEARDMLMHKRQFNAGDAAGAMSEALIIMLLNDAGFETIPSFPWQDQPYKTPKGTRNTAFDAYVITDGVAKPKVQVKSSLAAPPSGICEDIKETWAELDLEARRELMEQSYASDVAVIVLETDLKISVEKQRSYFKSLAARSTSSTRAWASQAMDVVTEAVW